MVSMLLLYIVAVCWVMTLSLACLGTLNFFTCFSQTATWTDSIYEGRRFSTSPGNDPAASWPQKGLENPLGYLVDTRREAMLSLGGASAPRLNHLILLFSLSVLVVQTLTHSFVCLSDVPRVNLFASTKPIQYILNSSLSAPT